MTQTQFHGQRQSPSSCVQLAAMLFAMVWLFLRYRDYTAKRRAGCWMEGIVVFASTGDVVARRVAIYLSS